MSTPLTLTIILNTFNVLVLFVALIQNFFYHEQIRPFRARLPSPHAKAVDLVCVETMQRQLIDIDPLPKSSMGLLKASF